MTQTANVFLVDDDEALRESITTLLTYYGYPVRAFPSAQSFLEATAADAAGCLILDLHMPGMDGLALQHKLLQARGTSNKDIALMLGISPRTVEQHRADVMGKMRVDSFAALCKLEPICRQTNDRFSR
jgi:FixJ family two-component response regulator